MDESVDSKRLTDTKKDLLRRSSYAHPDSVHLLGQTRYGQQDGQQ